MAFLENVSTESKKKITFGDFFSSLKSNDISYYGSQKDLIMEYRNEKIQERDVITQQSMALKRDREQFEAEKAEFASQKKACEQEKNRLQMLELRLKSMQRIMLSQSFASSLSVTSSYSKFDFNKSEYLEEKIEKSMLEYRSSVKESYCHRFYAGFIDKNKANKKKVLDEMMLVWSKKSKNNETKNIIKDRSRTYEKR